MSKPKSVESHAHRLAKQLLAKWLIQSNESVVLSLNNIKQPFAWRSNRPTPFGVWLEYPWTKEGHTVWDESGWDGATDWTSAIPTLDQFLKLTGGKYPDAIWDIAIQHKGSIVAAFEVVHKSPISEKKDALIRGSDISVYVISAFWILNQVDTPKIIKLDEAYCSGGVFKPLNNP